MSKIIKIALYEYYKLSKFNKMKNHLRPFNIMNYDWCMLGTLTKMNKEDVKMLIFLKHFHKHAFCICRY